MKVLAQVMVYLLVVAGAVLMLMPFAWMLMTSFKLPHEVETWPPTWSTKNVLRERTIKVVPNFGGVAGIDFSALSLEEFMNLSTLMLTKPHENVVLLKIDDDAPVRGRFIIRMKPYDYPVNDLLNLDALRSQIDECENNLPSEVKKEYAMLMSGVTNIEVFFERFLNLFLTSKNPIMGREYLPVKLEQDVTKILNLLKRYEVKLLHHPKLRITSGDSTQTRWEKEEVGRILRDTLENFKSSLSSFKFELTDYRKGLERVLTQLEVDRLLTKLERLISTDLHGRIIETLGNVPLFAKSVVSFYHRRFVQPLENWRNVIKLFKIVWGAYRSVQVEAPGDGVIIARIKTDEEKKEELLRRIEESDMDEATKGLLLDLVRKEDVRNVRDEFMAVMSDELLRLMKRHGFEGEKQVFLMILSDLAGTLSERCESGILEDTLGSSKTMEEFIERMKALGDFMILRKLEKYSHLTHDDDLLLNALRLKHEQMKKMEVFNILLSDVINSLVLEKAPPGVEKVRYVGRETLEVVTSFHSVWMYDTHFEVKVNFTWLEVFKNFFQNYVDAWHAAPFARYYINTVFVATTTTVLEVIVAAMAAFAFAKLSFFGRDVLFTVYLATMMVPGEVLMVPNYITLTKFGWIDTYYALIVPWIVQVFAIFLMRQHFKTLPDELFDAAKIDGCSKWRFLWTVMVPLSKPVVITAALLKFVGSWNAFLWVLIVTKSPEVRTLPVGLQTFSSEVGTLYNQLMAASTFSMLPVIVLFLFTQKYFIRGIARTGLK